MVQSKKQLAPEDFIKLIHEHKDRLKLSLRQVSKEAGLSPSYLSRILTGERSLPKDEEILRIANALKINPPERLLIEARRVPETKPRMLPLLRSASQLTDRDLKKVMAEVKRLIQEQKSKKEAKK